MSSVLRQRPPKGFYPAGRVAAARFCEPPSFTKKRKLTGVRAQGMRYEQRAQQHFLDHYPHAYVPGGWIRFVREDGSASVCQPDGYMVDFDRGVITVLEFKLRHCELAWWQLLHLYVPVMQALFRDWTFRAVEVCRWYDADIRVPQRPALLPDVMLASDRGWGVHIWAP